MTDTSDTPLDGGDETITETPASELPAETSQEGDDGATSGDSHNDDRFTEGEVLRFIRVRFPGNNRSFAFLAGKNEYHYGQRVVAMSDRGPMVGFVNSFTYETKFHKGLLPVRSIIRAATEQDLLDEAENFRREKRLEMICYKHIDKHRLDMQLTHVELTQMGKKAVFYFTAPTRIDFRGLVHDLVGEVRMRVELRQVSVRDRSAATGGLGPCGRELCCSSFLAKYGNVGIKLAKNQDLSLNSSKINGVCGQLKCCLTYEDEVYQEKRKRLPRENGLVKTKDGNRGKVVRLDILKEEFETISPEGIIRRYVAEMWDGPAEGLEMPRFFENGVTDNSKTLLGLEARMEQEEKTRAKEHAEAPAQARAWVDNLYLELFGEKTLGLSLPDVAEPENTSRPRILPDEEEEITYVAPAEELLDEDEEGDEDELLEGEDEEDQLQDDDEAMPGPHRPAQADHRPAPTPHQDRVPSRPQTPRPQHQEQRNQTQNQQRRQQNDQNRERNRDQNRDQNRNQPRDPNRQQQRPPQQGQGPRPEGERSEGGSRNRNRRRGRRGGGGGQGGSNGPQGGGPSGNSGPRPPQR